MELKILCTAKTMSTRNEGAALGVAEETLPTYTRQCVDYIKNSKKFTSKNHLINK